MIESSKIGAFFEDLPSSVKGMGGARAFVLRRRNLAPQPNRSVRVEKSLSGGAIRVTRIKSDDAKQPDWFTIQRAADPNSAFIPLLVRNPRKHAVTLKAAGVELGKIAPASYTILFVQPGEWALEAAGPDSSSPDQATLRVKDLTSGTPRAWVLGKAPAELVTEMSWDNSNVPF